MFDSFPKFLERLVVILGRPYLQPLGGSKDFSHDIVSQGRPLVRPHVEYILRLARGGSHY